MGVIGVAPKQLSMLTLTDARGDVCEKLGVDVSLIVRNSQMIVLIHRVNVIKIAMSDHSLVCLQKKNKKNHASTAEAPHRRFPRILIWTRPSVRAWKCRPCCILPAVRGQIGGPVLGWFVYMQVVYVPLFRTQSASPIVI